MTIDLIRAAVMGALFAGGVSAAPLQIYISPTGDDHAAATAHAPLQSLDAARDHVRALRQAGKVAGPVEVILDDGVYQLNASLELAAQDSGTADAPVTYRAKAGQTPRLFGGRFVQGFAPAKNPAVLARLAETARGHVMVADLPPLRPAVGDAGPEQWSELHFGGQPMIRARYPNAGWMAIKAVTKGAKEGTFAFTGDRPLRWRGEPDAWVYGYWYHNWSDGYLPIKAIDAHTITTSRTHHYGMRAGQRFIGVNLLCELDTPGEYYIDDAASRVYFWPPHPIDSAPVFITDLREPLIDMKGAAHIHFEGLTIEGGRGHGVVVHDGESVVIRHCVVHNLGDQGVDLIGGHHNAVIDCAIDNIGGIGIDITGGDRHTLEAGDNQAEGNRIHDFGRIYHTYHPGIRVDGVGNRVAHNLIYNAPHSAIIFSGNDHIIEYNDIHHIMLETDDAGAIYIGRDWTYYGNVERYNYIHHCGPSAAPKPSQPIPGEPGILTAPPDTFGANLIYLDDCVSGIEVYSNILVGGDRAVELGGGRDITIRNNICIGNSMGVWIDARGVGGAAKDASPGGEWQMYRKLKDVGYDRPPYSVRYPMLASIMKHNPQAPEGNVVERNIFIHVKEPLSLNGLKPGEIKQADNALDVKMEFTDAGNPLDLVRRLDAKLMREIHFEPIPIDKIGPQGK